MNILEKRIEKDFESFIRKLPKLEPTEFIGLCKFLGVQLIDTKAEKVLVEVPCKDDKDKTEEQMRFPVRPMEDVMNELMDKFLNLSKKRRRDINSMLKDAARGR